MAVKFVIDRIENNDICTVGNFFGYLDDKLIFESVSIENPKIGPERKQDLAIPAGTYTLDRRISPAFSKSFEGRPLFWVYNDEVPKDRYILIHHGNYEKDTEGCILLGTSIVRNNEGKAHMISSSKVKVKELLDKFGNESLEGAVVIINNKF